MLVPMYRTKNRTNIDEAALVRMWNNCEPVSYIAETFHTSRVTIYRHIAQLQKAAEKQGIKIGTINPKQVQIDKQKKAEAQKQKAKQKQEHLARMQEILKEADAYAHNV